MLDSCSEKFFKLVADAATLTESEPVTQNTLTESTPANPADLLYASNASSMHIVLQQDAHYIMQIFKKLMNWNDTALAKVNFNEIAKEMELVYRELKHCHAQIKKVIYYFVIFFFFIVM